MRLLDKIFKKSEEIIEDTANTTNTTTIKEKKLYSTLEIRFKSTSQLKQTAWRHIIDSENNIQAPWLHFIKWFHHRQQSESFRIYGKNTIECVGRDEITSYKIYISKE